MPPIVATLIVAVGILGLLYLDRGGSPRVSKALWIPALWLFIICSRPVSMWFNLTPTYQGGDATDVYVEGSPVDRAVALFLMFLALGVLFRRADRIKPFLEKNKLLIAYFIFCLVSLLWSDFPFVAFKRWSKTVLGDAPIVLVILTDLHPWAALKRVLTRLGFFLFPVSILLIRYYTQIGGRLTNSWTMEPVGVATQKNGLGLDCLIWGVFFLWMIISVYRERNDPSRGRRLLAYGTIFAMIVFLLSQCNSTTSIVGLACSAGVMLLAMRPRRRATLVHLIFVLVLGLATIALFFNPSGDMVEALGKSKTFSGRTEIWNLVLGLGTNPVVGTGFESFWLGSRLTFMLTVFPNLPINEAHNGWLEIYLNLGWSGVCFIAILALSAYKRVMSSWRIDSRKATLLLGFLLSTLFNAFSENAFRIMTPSWVFFLLVILATSQPELFQAPQPQAAPAAPALSDEHPAYATTTMASTW